jgi:tetratricopeptide (TPR) repeat protein
MMQFCNWIVWNGNPEPDRRNAMISAQRAVELAPNEAWAYGVLGNVLMGDLRWDEAKIQFEHALRLNPNDADIHIGTADYYICIGEPHRAMEYLATALRLNPHPPSVYFWKLGMAQISIGHYAEARGDPAAGRNLWHGVAAQFSCRTCPSGPHRRSEGRGKIISGFQSAMEHWLMGRHNAIQESRTYKNLG